MHYGHEKTDVKTLNSRVLIGFVWDAKSLLTGTSTYLEAALTCNKDRNETKAKICSDELIQDQIPGPSLQLNTYSDSF